MWIELPSLWIALINIIGIPIAHLGLAWGATRMPSSLFTQRTITPFSDWEISLHHHLFFTRHWKHLLPDAAPWMGGVPKAHLTSAEPNYLKQFITETRRGEFSHWAQVIVILGFIAWNPWPANLIIAIYAFASNLPCILNLRYTRARLIRVLLKREPTLKTTHE
ncbi:hypothetical protein SAMN02745181_3886 [Rubritalea squalenifaciens DSM 18772]|uniref:Glycosyl-4,4'-diaponeurosporenoate acyltransferase n=1 Tax=Rubritalea squalenifaciens DSM 18772 TaxID=1123071 RepID=A0A1M6ST17_9BACT|nr:hypothetical protein [Rubritalea squalenifaciens]SHK47829.1 hypothetical protein SAMN02745181_3886 [Rubritalea squalenifaciens DSM 18772]